MPDSDQYGIIVINKSSIEPKITCSNCKGLIDRIDNYCRYCGIKFFGTRIITSDTNKD